MTYSSCVWAYSSMAAKLLAINIPNFVFEPEQEAKVQKLANADIHSKQPTDF